MLKAEQIPDEVVEAAARKFAFYAGYTWGSKGLDHDAIRGEAAMVILSALNAWPDVVDTHPNNIRHLVLQFKEVSDDA